MAVEKIIYSNLYNDREFKAISRELKSHLPHSRWSRQELQEHLHALGLIGELGEIDGDECSCDHAFIHGIWKESGYVDIYYLQVPYDERTIYITEVAVCEG